MDGDSTFRTDVDERVAQLQHALTARIVVEQAKGMLAERYSLAPHEAYELIRLAARSNGIKVHALANSVLASRETPAFILDLFTTLPRHNAAPARAVENVFHEVNEALLKLAGPHLFVCECADTACTERIDVSAETMRDLHADRDLYVVRPTHVNLDIDQVVEAHAGFAVVRKLN